MILRALIALLLLTATALAQSAPTFPAVNGAAPTDRRCVEPMPADWFAVWEKAAFAPYSAAMLTASGVPYGCDFAGADKASAHLECDCPEVPQS
jgi:hypothetical protein